MSREIHLTNSMEQEPAKTTQKIFTYPKISEMEVLKEDRDCGSNQSNGYRTRAIGANGREFLATMATFR